MVERLAASPDQQNYFDEDIKDVLPKTHRGFVEREEIKSRATLKLRDHCGVVGVMFLNYRSRTTFDDDTKARCMAFAAAATLAIQKAQAQERRLQWQREQFQQTLHDEMKGTLFGMARLVNSVRQDPQVPQKHRDALDVAFDATTDLSLVVDRIVSSRQDLTMNDLRQEVERLVRFTQQSHAVEITLDWPSYAIILPSRVIRELKLIVSEALRNAATNGAPRIRISATVAGGAFECAVVDDGSGFDMSVPTDGRGLANMTARAEWLGGKLTVQSSIGSGTQVIVHVPMVEPQGADGVDVDQAKAGSHAEEPLAHRSA